ncbi:MAG: Fe-S cluster assembly protein HesB [Candidatus Eisenbacteria bacterium]|nr:Fe-S cluster assembly protein HesB [Candidatus Eisenbacteria bacterium]
MSIPVEKESELGGSEGRRGAPAAEIALAVRRPFRFRLMVLSHGWYALPPFRWDDGRRALDVAFRAEGEPVAFRVTSRRDRSEGQALRAAQIGGAPVGPAARREARAILRWVFRLDDDFAPFHRLAAERGELDFVVREGLGPFLRAPTLFEEFAKVLLTTNVSWSGTKRMVRNLIDRAGAPVRPWRGGSAAPRLFPNPSAVVRLGEKGLREQCGLGYRAPYLYALAAAVRGGDLDLDGFADPPRGTEELAASLASIRGFGPYAVSTLLVSLGRYDRLILDSWIRKTVSDVHFRSRPVTDRAIERRYAPWGRWKTLACWFDCAWASWLGNAHAAGETPDL